MNNVVIVTPGFPDHHLECLSLFYLNGLRIPVGIIKKSELMTLPEHNTGMVLIRKDAFSCNYRDKAMIMSFISQMNENLKEELHTYSPIGSEFVGTVIDVGKNVIDLKIGDRVIPNAQYPFAADAELHPGIPTNQASKKIQALPAKQLLRVPTQMPDDVAASFTIAGHTIYSMLEKANLKTGDNVLVTSLKSNTSLGIVSALKCKGVNIWGITTSAHFVDEFVSMGLNKIIVVDHRVRDFSEVEEISEFVKETGGFDVVFDPFFDLHLSKITSCMNVNSRYLSCGFYNQFRLKEKADVVGKSMDNIIIDCILKNISIIGNCLGQKRHLEQAVQDYISGKFDIKIDSVISGGEIAYFFDRTFNDPDRFGKVVYKYDD